MFKASKILYGFNGFGALIKTQYSGLPSVGNFQLSLGAFASGGPAFRATLSLTPELPFFVPVGASPYAVLAF